MILQNCRMCKGERLYKFLDLGFTPPADHFLRPDELKNHETHYPLEVYLCEDCGLCQLGYVVPPEVLYQNEYPYEPSTTKTGREHWQNFAKDVVQQLGLTSADLVVDIGSNVGVLLSAFRDQGTRIHGVDPAPNIVKIANDRGVETTCDFFSSKSAKEIIVKKGNAAAITATNVFAHVHDLDALMRDINELLTSNGTFIFEAPYFPELLKHLEYDTIYHEHLSYFSVRPLIPFFKKFDMCVYDVKRVDIHGGSIRVFVGKGAQKPMSARVTNLLAYEEELAIHSREVLDRFSLSVRQHRDELNALLRSLKQGGKRIAAVSAPAKGMTLLNYCRLGEEILDFVTEKSPLKIGRYTPGMHIPVITDAELLERKPDYALVLAWNFADEIIRNLDAFRKQGGKFIVPIPKPTIVG